MSASVAWTVIAGTAGSFSMYPFAVLLRRAFGSSLNVYGKLMADLLWRSAGFTPQEAPPWALHLQHLVIGWTLAIPLALLFRRLRPGRVLQRVLVGASYGALAWLLVNSLGLPFLFGRPSPWELGASSIWPSFLVHVVYGVSTWSTLSRRRLVLANDGHLSRRPSRSSRGDERTPTKARRRLERGCQGS